jgi:hypothetical protein
VSGVSYVAAQVGNYITYLDEQEGGVTYVGKAPPKSPTASPVWQIKRVLVVDGLLTLEYADGNDLFDNVWDNREAISYS